MNSQGRDGVLERNASVKNELAPPGATPTLDALPRRLADFDTLGDALDYAAKGRRGLNFHDARGTLTQAYTFARAPRGCAHPCAPLHHAWDQGQRPHRAGGRDGPRFRRLLLRCGLCRRVAGAASAADQLRRTRGLCRPACRSAEELRREALHLSRPSLPNSARRGGQGRSRVARLGDARRRRAAPPSIFRRATPTTSPIFNIPADRRASRTASRSPTARCSTISTRTASASRSTDTDRCISWLPWYHDMGLVGCLLSPVAMQMSVDYLKTEDFARRPLAWLDMITRNPGTRSAIRRLSAMTSARAG